MSWEWERVGLLGKLIKPTNQIRACHFVKVLVIMSMGVLNGGALDDVFIVLMQSRCNTFYSYYKSFLNKVEYKCWPSERTNLFIIPHGGSMGTWLKNVLLHASREWIWTSVDKWWISQAWGVINTNTQWHLWDAILNSILAESVMASIMQIISFILHGLDFFSRAIKWWSCFMKSLIHTVESVENI